MSTPVADQIALPEFNPASRQLQASDLFYVYQQQYGEVALPAQLVISYLRQTLGVSLFVTNGVPADNQGLNGDYGIDLATGIWYGPKTDGAWPGTTGFMTAGSLSAALQASITTQIQDAVIGGNGGPLLSSGAPSNLNGFPGQLCFDLTNGMVYGPYAAGSWGAPVPLLASALTSTLQSSILSTAKSQIENELSATTGATKVGYGPTTVDATLTTLTTQVENLISGGAGSTLIPTTSSGVLTVAEANCTMVFEGSNETNPVFSVAAGSTFAQNSFIDITNRAANPSAVLTVALTGNGDYFSTASYSSSNTGIVSVTLAQGDTLRIGLTGTNNFVLLGGTALLQFSNTNVATPVLSDSSNRPSTTGFGKTLRHGLLEIPITNNIVTISAVQAAYAILVFTGQKLANTTVYLPNQPGTYTLRNETTDTYTLSIGINAANTAQVVIPPGLVAFVMVRTNVGVFEAAADDSATAPVVTVFSTTIGNVAAGATTLSTTNLVSSLTHVFANGAFLTPYVDYNASGKSITLTNPVVAGVSYVVMSATLLNSSSLIYTPAIVPLTLAAGQTTLTYPYPIGFVDVYVGGALETNYTAIDGQTIVFPTSFSTAQAVTLRIYTPVVINGMLPLSGGTVSGNLTVQGQTTLANRPTFAGNTPLDSGNFSSLAVYAPPLTGPVYRSALSKMSDVVSILDFGADPTGTIDSTAAIQAALNSGYLNIYVPSGNFKFTKLTMPTWNKVTLYGEGIASNLIQIGAGLVWPTLAANNTSYFHSVRNLGFDGTSGTSHTINTSFAQNIDLMSLTFSNIPVGFASIKLDGNPTSSTYMHDVRATDIKIYSSTAGNAGIELGSFCADSSIDRFIMNGNFMVNYCILADNGASSTLISNSHPYNAKINIVKCAGNNGYLGWDGVTFDNAQADLFYMAGSANQRFTNCFFEAAASGYSGIVFDNSYNNNLSVSFFSSNAGTLTPSTACAREINGSSGNKFSLGGIDALATFATPFNLTGSGSFAIGIQGYTPLGQGITFSGVTTTVQAQNSTLYLGANGAQAALAATGYLVPSAAILTSVYVAVTTTPAAGQTFTFAVMDGSTQLGVGTIASGSYYVIITLNKAIAQYDQIGIQSVFSATSGSSLIRWCMSLMT